MKYFSRILFTVGLVFGLSACTEDALETVGPKLPDNGDMSVNLTFVMPDAEAQTRSKVSGTETLPVHTMQMVCFDANGLYLGIRNAVVSSNGASGTFVDTGVIKGTVPQGTSRIHFIANRKLTVPLNAIVGTPEAEVMASEELSTIWNDADHKEVCYWGYHKAESAEEMESWLNPTSADGTSKVYMIRDRAKIVLTYDPTDADPPVTKIEWLIHHGLERGYLAPAQDSWTNTGYYTNSTVSGHTNELISVAGMNVYPGDKRYTLWKSATENDENNFDKTYDAANGGNLNVPQFLFDDTNEEIDGVKVILRVTYTVNNASKTVYHVLKLNRIVDVINETRELYKIVRNNTYYIKAKLLSPDVAYYNTLEDAINGKEFMNAEMEVDRSITEVNNKEYTLQILLPTETTSIVLNRETEWTMDFAFREVADITQSGSTDTDDFEIKWEKEQTFCSAPTLTYNSTTKLFTIHTTVLEDQLTQKLQSEWIVVKHKATGLTRFIHVFAIDQFRYRLYPKLTRVGTGNYGDCLLTFQLPPAEHTQFLPDGSPDPNELVYPQELYPIDVKFTTNTLNAYGTTQGTTNYGLFGVAVESTSGLVTEENFETGYKSPVSSTNTDDMSHWYFQQGGNFWDFWYTYSLKTCPEDGIVNIYFKDVRQNIQYATVGDVGLFLYVEYFGKNYSIPLSDN